MIFWLCRTYSFFLGFFLILTLGLRLFSPQVNLWWFDLTPISPNLSRIFLLLLFSVGLLSFAVFPPKKRWYQTILSFILLIFLFFAGKNIVSYYQLLSNHQIYSGPLLPFSFFVFFSLLTVLYAIIKSPAWAKHEQQKKWIQLGFFLGSTFLFALLFPATQIFCFGRTDYRRSADVIVVFGAKTYANGTPSRTLASRVKTACELYKEGYAKTLIFSGGPGDGMIHETEAMKNLALQQGVQEQDIILDQNGLNTQATVQNTLQIFQKFGFHRILVVSDFTHLPRIKLTYQLAGQQVYTVPAHEFPKVSLLLFQLGRETIAFWAYYFRMDH